MAKKKKISKIVSDPFYSDDEKDTMLRRLQDLSIPKAQFIDDSPPDQPGRFSYLFPDLSASPSSTLPTDDKGKMLPSIIAGLEALADSMNAASTDSTIHGGMTYLGQFIDHDLTFDPTSSFAQLNDPNTIRNFRSPGLNLDNLYGSGPRITPYQYDGNNLRVGGFNLGRDLPRAIQTSPAKGNENSIAKAIIGDPRNDENLIVAQLHCSFIGFHNKVVEIITAEGGTPPEKIFSEAAQRVRWHYQWIVVNEFLPTILRSDILDDVKLNGGKFFKPKVNGVTVPVEFSMAAYRFGHSMVRDDYKFNSNFPDASLFTLFSFTGSKIPDSWEKAQWSWFFQFGTAHSENLAKLIDTKITDPMHNIPTPEGTISVPRNNLKRGYAFNLPTGQAVARKMGISLLTEEEISQSGGVELSVFTANPIFKKRTPLWYYILKESEVKENGARLGAVGSRIVAEVFLGILRADRSSYFNSPLGEDWKPTLPPLAAGTSAGDFRIVDLIVYAMHAQSDGTPT